mmetsp:Transcript_41552/g.87175  ORF Transcript_41552/g.87175 Transcript_41552/m.87175 type:complete len:444 (-) Transcript_41552:156-1487(-)
MSHERRRHQRSLTTPSQRKLRQRHPRPLRNHRILPDRLLRRLRSIPVQRPRPPELVHPPPRILHRRDHLLPLLVVQRRRSIHVLSREHPPRQGVVRHEPHVLVVRRRRLGHAVLLALAIDQREVSLEGAGRGHAQGLGRAGASRESVGVVVAESPSSNLAVVDQVLHGEAKVLEGGGSAEAPPVRRLVRLEIVRERLSPVGLGRVPCRPVELVHVDVIRAQPLQTAVAVLSNVLGGDIPAPRDFGGDDHLITGFALVEVAALHPLSDGEFGVSLGRALAVAGDGILLGRVDEIDAGFEDGLVHEVEDLIFVWGVVIGGYPTLRSQSQFAHDDIRSAQSTLSHPIDAFHHLVRRSLVGILLHLGIRIVRGVRSIIIPTTTPIAFIGIEQSGEETACHHAHGSTTTWRGWHGWDDGDDRVVRIGIVAIADGHVRRDHRWKRVRVA